MLRKFAMATTLSIITMSTAYAMPNGSYLGFSGSQNTLSRDEIKQPIVIATDKHKQYGGGIFAGYQMPNDIGIMFSANYFGKFKYNVADLGQAKSQYFDVDALITAGTTLGRTVNVYAGVGGAYVLGKISELQPAKHKNPRWWRPKAMVGVDFTFANRYALGVSYAYILGKGNMENAVKNNDGKDYLPDIRSINVNLSFGFNMV